MGDDSEAVLSSTNPTEDDRKTYDGVMTKFESFFVVRKNVIFKLVYFYRRSQLQGETAEKYIMELHALAEFQLRREDSRNDTGPPSSWNQG